MWKFFENCLHFVLNSMEFVLSKWSINQLFLKLSNYSQIAFSNRKLKNHKITCIHYLY